MRKLLSDERVQETFRYLICGISTVVVNIALYHVLSEYGNIGTLTANTIAFFLAVLYAFFGNSIYVFRTKCTWRRFWEFMMMRIGTLAIDNIGMYLMVSWQWNDILAKCVVNVVIIAINYIFSKLLIFKKK